MLHTQIKIFPGTNYELLQSEANLFLERLESEERGKVSKINFYPHSEFPCILIAYECDPEKKA